MTKKINKSSVFSPKTTSTEFEIKDFVTLFCENRTKLPPNYKFLVVNGNFKYSIWRCLDILFEINPRLVYKIDNTSYYVNIDELQKLLGIEQVSKPKRSELLKEKNDFAANNASSEVRRKYLSKLLEPLENEINSANDIEKGHLTSRLLYNFLFNKEVLDINEMDEIENHLPKCEKCQEAAQLFKLKFGGN